MDALKALGWILTHLGRSRRKYPNVDSTSNALARTYARLALAKMAADQPDSPENRTLLAKTLLQTAGLCVRAAVDLNLDHPEMVPLLEGELGTAPVLVGFKPAGTPPEVLAFWNDPRAVPALPDWAGPPELHELMARNASTELGPHPATDPDSLSGRN